MVENVIVSLPQLWRIDRSHLIKGHDAELTDSFISDLPLSNDVADELVELAFDESTDPSLRRHAQFILIYRMFLHDAASYDRAALISKSWVRAFEVLSNKVSFEDLVDRGSARQDRAASQVLKIMIEERAMSSRWFAARTLIPLVQSAHEDHYMSALTQEMSHIRMGVSAMMTKGKDLEHFNDRLDSLSLTYRELYLHVEDDDVVDLEIEGLIDMIETGEFIHAIFAVRSLGDFIAGRMAEDPAAVEEAGKRLVRIAYFDEDVEEFRYRAIIMIIRDVLDSSLGIEQSKLGIAWRVAFEAIKALDSEDEPE